MTTNNFVLVNKPTSTSLYLIPLIFNKDALATLRVYGLVNVYLDDYGATRRYKDCLFFLFHPSNNSDYKNFEAKITDFSAFYDYYEVANHQNLDKPMIMYVFKVHRVYLRDLFSFKHNRLDELSNSFYNISDKEIDFTLIKVDISQEIYRFSLGLEVANEDLP